MKKHVAFIASAALVLGLGSLASAAPSFYGPTGLVVMPSAQSLSQNQFDLFANQTEVGTVAAPDEGTYTAAVASSDDTAKLSDYGMNYGVGYGVELGLTMIKPEGASTESTVNAKWNFLAESATKPALAVGALNVLDNDDAGDIAPYVVASKSLSIPGSPVGIAGHIGYLAGDIDKWALGASANISPKLSVSADWIKDYSDFGIGVRWMATDALRVNATSIDGEFGFGASYAFSLSK